MAFLERARLIDPFLGLRTDPSRYALASFLTEMLDRLAAVMDTEASSREVRENRSRYNAGQRAKVDCDRIPRSAIEIKISSVRYGSIRCQNQCQTDRLKKASHTPVPDCS